MPYTNRFAFTRSYSRSIHAKVRANQRYHIDLSPAQSIKIGQYIRDRRGETLQPGSVVIVAVQLSEIDPALPNRRAIVAYDRRKREVVTFLPDDWTLEVDIERRRVMGENIPVPSSHVPVQRDCAAMTISEATDWRSLLVEAGTTAKSKVDRAVLQHMIMNVNKRIKALNKLKHDADCTTARERRALAKVEKNRLDEESLTTIFEEMWTEDHPDQ